MKTRHFFPAIMICHIGILLLMSCGGQPQNTASDGVSFKNDDAFHQALREQAADINEVNQKAEQQRAEQQRAEIERRERMEREYQEEKSNMLKSQILEVLQGAWEWCGSISPNQLTVAQLYIEGDYIKDLSDGMENAQGSIREIDFDNGKIYYGRDNYLNFLIDKDGDFHLYGGRRSIQFQKLSERTLEYRSKYNEHLKWWEDAYNAYRINKYPNSTIQNIKDMKYALGYLQDDVDHGGNKKMKERVRELARITGELQPY